MRKLIPLLAAAAVGLPAVAQLRDGYVDWGTTGPGFGAALFGWQKGQAWTQDDNFFISRVALHPRFRDASTQVRPSLDESNDKNLLMWVPVNSPGFNALPDGKWDCEVFPMWQYVTHYGNWSTSLVRVPAAFTDAAHRNGVPVSCVAGVPYGSLNQGWRDGLQALVDAGADRLADFLQRFGVDGVGYNSEFAGGADLVQKLEQVHSGLRQRMGGVHNVWYDGTQANGSINFDMGLTDNNAPIWGGGDDPRTLLFFNYNWNRASLIDKSIAKAQALGRSPLDLYCGFNMQGAEPKSGTRWPMLVDKPLSIGLWGAHSENMFWESRGEQGSDAASKQRAYMERVERWFTGGTRNPLTCPPVSDDMSYNAKNYDFFGMSSFMSARSSLSWDLAAEPFVTHFNLGNGRFFNFRGKRQNALEWYNLGVQDHLPTWRWLFTKGAIADGASAVPARGLDAEFTWDDAYFGGSCVRVFGTTDDEYLYLFKTRYALRLGDQVTFTYKMVNGSADMELVLVAAGGDRALAVGQAGSEAHGTWVTKTFTVGQDVAEGTQLDAVALRLRGARSIDVLLGGLAVTRPGAYGAPVAPEITSAQVLHADWRGADAKVIFNVPNTVEPERTCLNTDVNASMFLIYAQQQGREPVMVGATSSWAAIAFNVPVDLDGDRSVRLGVSALSLDMASESAVAWTDYMDVEPAYQVSDDIAADAGTLHPGQPFSIAYVDPLHPAAAWTLTSAADGAVVARVEASTSLAVTTGLPAVGNYDLSIDCGGDVRRFPAYLQAIAADCGNQPRITSLDAPAQAEAGRPVEMAYAGAEADGQLSRGVALAGGEGTGFRWKDTGAAMNKSFSIAFWMRSDGWQGANSLLNIRDKMDTWPKNAWGWLWSTVNDDGTPGTFVIRGSQKNISYTFGNTVISPNVWHHYAYVFEFNTSKKVVPHFYLDGVEQPVTAWSVGDAEQPLPVAPTGGIYPGREDNVVSVGGSLHTGGGAKGALDNLQFYARALSADEMPAVMGDAPADATAWWSFEADADADGCFESQGAKAIPAGAVSYVSGGGEGQGQFAWGQAQLTGGCPMLTPTGAYAVRTTAQWDIPGAKVEAGDCADTAGRATVTFPAEGTYEGTLTLTNCHGSDTRAVSVTVAPGSGLEQTLDDGGGELQVWPRVFSDSFTVSGTGTLTLTDMAGRTVHTQRVDGYAVVTPTLPAGAYVATLAGRAAKMVKK